MTDLAQDTGFFTNDTAGGSVLNISENHLLKIQKILESDQGLLQRLEQVGEYLIQTHQISCVSIFRRVGDEMDDVVFVSNKMASEDTPVSRASKQTMDRDLNFPVRIISSKFTKPRKPASSSVFIPEFIIPIIRVKQIMGFLHAEKSSGGYFNAREIRVLRETAKLIGKLFTPRVIHLN